MKRRSAAYWLATAAVTGELLLGGICDIARLAAFTVLTVKSWSLRRQLPDSSSGQSARCPGGVAS